MHPYSDVTVVELCREGTPAYLRLAQSMASRLASGMGARVFCVEPEGRDPLDRVAPHLPGGASAAGTFLKLGKSIIAPADSAETVRIVDGLLQQGVHAVVVAEGEPLVEAFRSAGVAVIELATWPVAMPSDIAAAPASEFAILAVSGILDLIGDPTREPLRLAGHQVAYAAGLAAFTALGVAIFQQDRGEATGGARISLVETAIWMNWKAIVGAAAGEESLPTRRGEKAEFQVLPCADGWIAFVYTQSQFNRVKALFGDLEIDDPRFQSRQGREAHVRDFMAALQPWFSQRTREQIYAEARRHGVPLGPVYRPRELIADSQYEAGQFFSDPVGPAGIRFPRIPATWDGQRFEEGPTRRVKISQLASEPCA